MLPEPLAPHPSGASRAHPWFRAAFPVLALLAAANVIGALFLAPDRGGDFAMLYESTVRWLHGEPAYVSSQATTNLNHPLVWLIIAPLTALPGQTAFIVWSIVSLFLLCFSVVYVRRVVATSLSTLDIVVLLLASTGAGFEMGLGQIAFVLTVPYTLAWSCSRHSKPVQAGVWLGVLCALKPFLGLYALWYLARREWRTLSALVASAALTLGAGFLLAGDGDSRQWLLNLQNVSWTWHVFNASVFGVAARLFAPQDVAIATAWTPLLVSPVAAACAGWGAAVSILLLLAQRLRVSGHDRSFALLGLSALLVSPLGWNYYLPMLCAPVLASMTDRELPWWSAVVGACAVCPYALIVNRHYAIAGTLLVGQIAVVSVMGLFLLVRPATTDIALIEDQYRQPAEGKHVRHNRVRC